MPHTNRKKRAGAATTRPKRNSVHTKRTQVLDEEGWVHIVDSAGRVVGKGTAEAGGWHGGDFTRGGVEYVDKSVEEMRADFEGCSRAWMASEACAGLKIMIGEMAGRELGNVVCLGLGSLQSARREGRRRSFTQLAALQTILSSLNHSSQCVFQDPQFAATDTEFLTSLGYTVVEDPDAFSYIKENTLVYAIHCYARVYQSISEGPRPAILISTNVENFGKFILSEESVQIAESLEKMVEPYQSFDFPALRHDFSDTKVYFWPGTPTSISIPTLMSS
ncbi:hypothetical protein B7494_g8627 [Chlorociboria aeruginascens]|nr:hypothetical protein B7494_g8627 [Chlorociboria aeruginascens]